MSAGGAKTEDDEMRYALSAIANEIQQLNKGSVTISQCNNEEILSELIKYKAALNLKTLQTRHLRRNLNSACVLAKAISSAKAIEVAALNKHLEFARKQYFDLEKQQNEKNLIINNLRAENGALRDQLKFFKYAIQLGYEDLQGIRNECVENIPALEQLKHIITCCGQYHAEHFNDLERSVRLQQKNRFLSTKMIIMEKHLEAARDEFQNSHKEKKYTLTRSQNHHCIGDVSSDYKLASHQRNLIKPPIRTTELTKCSSLVNIRHFDLNNHLKKVKNLLIDHENMIKELKNLTKL